MEYEDVALFAAGYFIKAYPEQLKLRYKLESIPDKDIELLEAIGRKRGCLQSGGIVNIHKASEILVNEFRNNSLGRISLETPEMMQEEREESSNN